MRTVSASWRYIGQALRFSKKDLDTIAEKAANKEPIECLLDLLTQWLSRPHQQKEATEEDTMEASMSPTMGEKQL